MLFPNFNSQSPFFDALEGSDVGQRANFYGRNTGMSQGQQTGLNNLFEPTFNRYLGALGQQILGGQSPTLTWTDYLNQNFNPQRELLRIPSSRSSPQLTSPTRFFFGA